MLRPGNDSKQHRCFGLGRAGQSTVELAVCLPIILVMVLVSYNVALYLSACARFDPLAAEAVRTQATSPGAGEYGQSTRAGLIQDCLTQVMGDSYDVTISVSIESITYGNLDASDNASIVLSLLPAQERVICTMQFNPWGIPRSVFGISLPVFTHHRMFVIDPYRPGGLF